MASMAFSVPTSVLRALPGRAHAAVQLWCWAKASSSELFQPRDFADPVPWRRFRWFRCVALVSLVVAPRLSATPRIQSSPDIPSLRLSFPKMRLQGRLLEQQWNSWHIACCILFEVVWWVGVKPWASRHKECNLDAGPNCEIGTGYM
jgi:hypothetical protein